MRYSLKTNTIFLENIILSVINAIKYYVIVCTVRGVPNVQNAFISVSVLRDS